MRLAGGSMSAGPGLPAAVLPAGWQGDKAAEFFDVHTRRLEPAADEFVDRRLRGGEAEDLEA
jgi:phenylacetic acid degradation operon negative regulatory protein